LNIEVYFDKATIFVPKKSEKNDLNLLEYLDHFKVKLGKLLSLRFYKMDWNYPPYKPIIFSSPVPILYPPSGFVLPNFDGFPNSNFPRPSHPRR
jgi:hypothetical protein